MANNNFAYVIFWELLHKMYVRVLLAARFIPKPNGCRKDYDMCLRRKFQEYL